MNSMNNYITELVNSRHLYFQLRRWALKNFQEDKENLCRASGSNLTKLLRQDKRILMTARYRLTHTGKNNSVFQVFRRLPASGTKTTRGRRVKRQLNAQNSPLYLIKPFFPLHRNVRRLWR